MAPPSPRSASRYRRRILGLGALAAFGLYVIGAPIFANRIEDDLEQRVPEELSDTGFDGIAASFSGQDGTLRCEQPLDDPELALEAAYDVWGVRAIELDRSCRVNRAPVVATTTVEPDVTLAPPIEAAVPSETDGDVPTPTLAPTTTVAPDFATVADIVTTDPQFSLLSVLAQESGFVAELGDTSADAITFFAPVDAAFDDVPADVIAQLRTDPDVLMRVLHHHVVAGRLTAADLADGSLPTQDGGSVDVRVGDEITVDDATIVNPDLSAGNGVVHAIDQLLVPADLDLTAPSVLSPTSATFDDGLLTLVGTVASEVERASLVATASDAVGSDNVVDQLEVDPDVGLDADTVASLAQLVAAMPANLVAGVAGFDGTELYVAGTFIADAERDAMTTIAESVGANADLEARPDATEADAVDLEAELNAFVADNPILFEPSSAVLSPSAFAVLDRIALEAQQFAGVAITVEGHTDSDGGATENLALSQLRAIAVSDALVERGIAEASITAQGFGSEQPVLVDGEEDKNASRRVEFRVVTTP